LSCPALIDTHCHLTSRGLVEQVAAVLGRAREAGVQRAITVAVDERDALVALGLLEQHPDLFLTAGLHPHEAGRWSAERWAKLTSLLRGDNLPAELRRRIVAIGETGLDYHYDFAPPLRQEEVFRRHLSLAAELGKPVVVHARLAEQRVLEILGEFPGLAGRVVFHCFSGDRDMARRVLDHGCHCSFAGVVTFKNATRLRAAAQYVPGDRLLIETDAPYLSPEPLRKIRPNEPALLVHTARFLADLRGEDVAELAAASSANAARFFDLPED